MLIFITYLLFLDQCRICCVFAPLGAIFCSLISQCFALAYSGESRFSQPVVLSPILKRILKTFKIKACQHHSLTESESSIYPGLTKTKKSKKYININSHAVKSDMPLFYQKSKEHACGHKN